MSIVRVHLFGYPRIECDDEPIHIPRRKAVALLAYLAVSCATHGRDMLATLLWPDHDTSRAYAFLRNALWVLNQTPLTRFLVSTRHMAGLRANPGLWIDVCAFRAELRACCTDQTPLSSEMAQHLAVALDTQTEPFLSGFAVEDSRAFEEWQFAEADSLKQELGQGLSRLGEHHEALGAVDLAIEIARRQLALQPLNESFHRRLIRLHAQLGDRAAALAQYEACVGLLDRELGLPPEDETTDLAERIRRGALQPPSGPASPPPRKPAIPVSPTPLIGRDRDLREIENLLSQRKCRLLTLIGTGGAGKTRLAIAAAQRLAPRYPDGLYFIPLASLDSADLVPAAIAAALGIRLPRHRASARIAGDDRFEGLARHLAERKALFIFDSAEQVAHALHWVSRLLDAPNGPTLLVTSRQPLDVHGEWLYDVTGLSVPDAQAVSDDIVQATSVQLFLQSARRFDARFAPTPGDIASIADICRRLSGLPLGLELAAAWVRSASCREIQAEIARSLDFLAVEGGPGPHRHRSLRAAFAGSWALLDRDGRRALRALSVFRGGFSRDAARAVTSVDLPALAGLLSKSLVHRVPPERYEMLEVVRQYGAERLRATPDAGDQVRQRHAAFYLSLLSSQEQRLKGPQQRLAAATLAADIDNIHAAWHFAASVRRTDLIEAAAMSLFIYCDMRNHFEEGAELCSTAAQAFSPERSSHARLLYGFLEGLRAWFIHFDNAGRAEQLYARAFSVLDQAPLGRWSAFLRVLAGFSDFGEPSDRASGLLAAIAFFQEHGLLWEKAEACEAMVSVDPEASPKPPIEWARESVALHEKIGDPWGEAMAHYTLGRCFLNQAAVEAAKRQFHRSLDLRRALGEDPFGGAACLLHLGEIAENEGDPAGAIDYYHQALESTSTLGQSYSIAVIRERLAALAYRDNRMADAAAHVDKAIASFSSLGLADDEARCRALADEIQTETS